VRGALLGRYPSSEVDSHHFKHKSFSIQHHDKESCKYSTCDMPYHSKNVYTKKLISLVKVKLTSMEWRRVILMLIWIGISSGVASTPIVVDDEDNEIELSVEDIENCVPYQIRSWQSANTGLVSWETQRTYKHGKTSEWLQCEHGGAEIQYRALGAQDAFITKNSRSFLDVNTNITVHKVWIPTLRDMQYEFIVGSPKHGWSNIHRLGSNVIFANALQEKCKPVRVHSAYGQTPDSFTIQWTTDSSCILGNHTLVVDEGYPANFNESTTKSFRSHSSLFIDGGKERLQRFMHVAYATGLKSNTRYSYYVGNSEYSKSITFSFKTPVGAGDSNSQPLRLLVTGDIGYQNAATLPMMQSQVARGEIDGVVSIGDYAYNLHNANGVVGDVFMTEIEPIAAYVPFMVTMGNHEIQRNFSHYTERFRLMPSNTGYVTSISGPSPNNWFYSYNVGLVHFVVICTEIYFARANDEGLIEKQLQWLQTDLRQANANRTSAPWLIVMGHRPMYCTSDLNCDKPAAIMRDAFEDLFYEHGVDIYLCGHQHNYERAFDIYKGRTWRRTRNMKATTHILTGAAGQSKVLPVRKPFLRRVEPWDAFRNAVFGFGRITVHNSTHVHWQQVECDPSNPAAHNLNGKPVDDVWLIQEDHGVYS